jgi:hypothetical protein
LGAGGPRFESLYADHHSKTKASEFKYSEAFVLCEQIAAHGIFCRAAGKQT